MSAGNTWISLYRDWHAVSPHHEMPVEVTWEMCRDDWHAGSSSEVTVWFVRLDCIFETVLYKSKIQQIAAGEGMSFMSGRSLSFLVLEGDGIEIPFRLVDAPKRLRAEKPQGVPPSL